jgi:hypothetical protein
LNRVRPSKKIKFYFLFLIGFIDNVAFAEYDRNPNFVPNYILPDVVARLRNQENCSPCRMYFIHDGIVDSLIEQ